jgi:hypothetical protein
METTVTHEELLAHIEAIRADYAERAEPRRSGYIDPSEADLAREDGKRDAFGEIASELASLLASARTA